MKIILAHENSDFDAIASILAAHKLYPDALPVLAQRKHRNVDGFLALYGKAFPFVEQNDIPRERIDQLILVDTCHIPPFKGIRKYTRITVIDHHPMPPDIDPRMVVVGEHMGANATLMVERLQAEHMSLSPLEATLLALGIYEDTGSLTYASTTPRDIRAAAWLLEQGADLDILLRFLDLPLSGEQQSLFESLLRTLETRTVDGFVIMLGAVTIKHVINELSSIAHKLIDALDPTALILIIESPGMINLIGRSRHDTLDMGMIARAYGGGGHTRAAAAVIREHSLQEVRSQVWSQIQDMVQVAPSMPRVRDLMSHGVLVFWAFQPLREVLPLMRRIGHEGYPVLENEQVVGLLTHRDADRAGEHNLESLPIRDVMMAGAFTVTPDSTLAELEHLIMTSGWGQIPVVDDEGRIIGIVTRTDLINYYADSRHSSTPQAIIRREKLSALLGKSTAFIIENVGQLAEKLGVSVYLVGGVVRDLLLERLNLDLDFVVEGDALAFADQVVQNLGGRLVKHSVFGTAKWILNHSSDKESELEYIDFVSARNEYYHKPSALPTVYKGSIKLDLRRRDFTINTLAMRITPADHFGEIVDYFGGIGDLQNRLIRVLHSLSFVDDPTRILRAVRFEYRLNFSIEERTAALLQTALPLLERVTGERIANELTLLLREPWPERALLILDERGILRAIHPKLAFTSRSASYFWRVRERQVILPVQDIVPLYWHMWALSMNDDSMVEIAERLLLGKTLIHSLQDSLDLRQLESELSKPDLKPSEVVHLLDKKSNLSLVAYALAVENELIQDRLTNYVNLWRHIHAWSSGNTLLQIGLAPGPCYSALLRRLRAARLDGETKTESEEHALLHRLVSEGFCDGGD